jgi:hypothetical protein
VSDQAGEVFRCALCGRPDLRCLCEPCRLAHSTLADDPKRPGERKLVLHPAVAAIQREAKRQTARAKRAQEKGITLESFERLDSPGRT